MIEFEVVDTRGFLGKKRLMTGNTEKYWARFESLLDRGVILTDATATVTSALTTVDVPELSDDKKSLFFTLTSTDADETFTLALQVETSDGQVLNWLIVYDVATPVV